MSAESFKSPSHLDDARLRAALISTCQLSTEAIGEILDLMRSAGLQFGEASLSLGLVSQEQLEDAIAWFSKSEQEFGPSIVESAINKVSSAPRREIVVRENPPVRPGPSLAIANDSYSPRSEKIRALRTELLLLNEASREASVLAVLSPCPSEGRTQLSAELAIAFAQLGRRTLLVDADLRRPQLHTLFDADNLQGLSQSLANNQRPPTHPVIGLESMSLLTAGPIPSNPLELLSAGRFEMLLSSWKRSYEFIVLDTPAVTQYADGLAVATFAGRVLLLSRAKHTPFAATKDMLRRLDATQSRVLGAVINYF